MTSADEKTRRKLLTELKEARRKLTLAISEYNKKEPNLLRTIELYDERIYREHGSNPHSHRLMMQAPGRIEIRRLGLQKSKAQGEIENLRLRVVRWLAPRSILDTGAEKALKYFHQQVPRGLGVEDADVMIRMLEILRATSKNTQAAATTYSGHVEEFSRASEATKEITATGQGLKGSASSEAERMENRKNMLAEAQARWALRPPGTAQDGQQPRKTIPFAWVYKHAKQRSKEAYRWLNGKLPDGSVITKAIERVIEYPSPPPPPLKR